jgi:hypothetical protein
MLQVGATGIKKRQSDSYAGSLGSWLEKNVLDQEEQRFVSVVYKEKLPVSLVAKHFSVLSYCNRSRTKYEVRSKRNVYET